MKKWWLLLMAALLWGAACTPPPGLVGDGGGGQPSANIVSPATGSTVPVGEPVNVDVSAADPSGPGVTRIDLLVDGVIVNTFNSAGPQGALTAQLTFTPTEEGAVSVAVVAYNQDGTPSQQASIALSVVGATMEADTSEAVESSEGEEGGDADEEADEPSEPSSSGVRVQAQAKREVPIREKPGPGCPIIGVWEADDTGDFLVRTTSTTEYWYRTDYLGENQIGYVYQGQEQINFSLLGDDSVLPREPEEGCLYCGDGVCSEEVGEVCDECVDDCGVCPFCGDGVVNQDSEECDSGGCDEGFTCNASCLCEEVPEPEPEPECGNGVLEPGEACENDSHCQASEYCTSLCTCDLFI